VKEMKRKKCGNCGKVGHNKRTCTEPPTGDERIAALEAEVAALKVKLEGTKVTCPTCRGTGKVTKNSWKWGDEGRLPYPYYKNTPKEW